MVTGILIPRRTSIPMRRIELSTLMDYQLAVGGYIDTMTLERYGVVLVMNEEGKLKRLNVNRRATCIWWLFADGIVAGDVLQGDVVIVGAEEAGEFTDAPPEVVSLLLESQRFQVQVQLSRESDLWVPIGDPVSEFFDANVRALQLMEVWQLATTVRVVPAP